MTLRLKYSKTDPFGKGHIVTLYKTGRPTCPVTSMQVDILTLESGHCRKHYLLHEIQYLSLGSIF